MIANEVNAIFDRNATSGLHSLEDDRARVGGADLLEVALVLVVRASGASASPHGASPVAGYAIPSNAPAEADGATLPGASLAGALGDAVVPVQAAMIAAVPSNAANRSGKLAERVMRRYSSSYGPARRLVDLPADRDGLFRSAPDMVRRRCAGTLAPVRARC